MLSISLLIPLIAAGALLSRLLQSAKRLAASNLPGRIWLPLLVFALIVAKVAIWGTITLLQIFVCMAISLTLVAIWQWRKACQIGLIKLGKRTQLYPLLPTLKVSAPMMLAFIVAMGMTQIDLFMLESLGSEEDVGHYAAGATSAHFVILVQVTIIALFAPLIGPAIESGLQTSKSVFWQAQRLIIYLALPVGAAMILLAPELLALFGNSFQSATGALRLLTIAYLISAASALSSTWLQYSAKGKSVVTIGCIALLINIGANFALIGPYGLNGAAAATLIAMTCAAILLIGANFKLFQSQSLTPIPRAS